MWPWRQRLSQSVVCKLETQERWWCSSEAESWRNNGEVPVWIWRPERQKCWRQEKTFDSAHATRQRKNSTFLHLFVLSSPSVDWMMPAYIGGGHLLYSGYQFKCSSLPETLSQMHLEIIFSQLSQQPLVQSSWHTKLIIPSRLERESWNVSTL